MLHCGNLVTEVIKQSFSVCFMNYCNLIKFVTPTFCCLLQTYSKCLAFPKFLCCPVTKCAVFDKINIFSDYSYRGGKSFLKAEE